MTSRPLIVRLCNWIGDVVLSVPALRRLEAAGFQLHLYGKGWAPALLRGYDWPVTVRAATLRERVRQLADLRRQVQQGDVPVLALAMPNSFSSALEMRLAGLSVAGYARDGRSLLLSRRIAPGGGEHAVESFWTLAGALAGGHGEPPAFIDHQIAPASRERMRALVAERGWTAGYVCIAPFAAGTVHKQPKRWPGFPAFAQHLAATGLPLLICPGPGEVEEARSAYPQAHILDKLPLDDYAALLQGSRLVVANDTGPAHIAAGVGAPLISVLGPTKVEQWRPWGPSVQVLSARPDWPAMATVQAAAAARLQQP